MIETNLDALDQDKSGDRRIGSQRKIRDLDDIRVLLKDSIDTKDELNTMTGSLALVSAEVSQDAMMVKKLREAEIHLKMYILIMYILNVSRT